MKPLMPRQAVERLIVELDHYQVFTRRIALVLGCKDGGNWCGRTPLPCATASFQVIAGAAKGLLREAGVKTRIHGMHFLADELSYRHNAQLSLFHPTNLQLDRVKRLVNEKVGRFAVRSGETLPINDIYDDPTHQYDICDVRGKMCF